MSADFTDAELAEFEHLACDDSMQGRGLVEGATRLIAELRRRREHQCKDAKLMVDVRCDRCSSKLAITEVRRASMGKRDLLDAIKVRACTECACR